MPTISKQTTKRTATPNSESIRSRITPVSRVTGGIKLNVYGRGKTGKTRFGCTFPKPLLVIGTEDGTKSVSNVKGVEFVKLHHSSELEDLTALLREGKYLSAVLDQGGGLQDMMLKEVLGLEDIPVQRSWGMAERGDWMTCGAQWKERMSKLLNLADTQDLNVVVIAHERNFNEEANSDVMMPSVGSALTPTVAGWLNGACDYICHAFIRQKEIVKEITINKKVTKQRVPTKEVEYCLRVGAHPVYMTGFRLPQGVILPDSIVDPTYDKIVALING